MKIMARPSIPSLAARLARPLFGGEFPAFVDAADRLSFETAGGIRFAAPTALARWRAQTYRTKEPGTIAWIDTFGRADVFWDAGANVGVYSLYAAAKRGCRVLSFEPSPFNFAPLSRNIALNALSSLISAFCIALSDKTVMDRLHMSSTGSGAAHSGFAGAADEFGKPVVMVHDPVTLGFRIDDFIRIFGASVPTHLKIDVDGAETAVIAGAADTLRNPALQSILIELPVEGAAPAAILDTIRACGFKTDRTDHPDGDTRLVNHILRRV